MNGIKRTERDAYLKAQYTPSSPLYRKWLTPEQYGEKFGASPQDVQAVVAYAKSQGFTVTKVWPNNSFVAADATVSQTEAAFNTRIAGFNRPAYLVAQGEPATFFAPSATPSVPASIASKISFIGGLSNIGTLHHGGLKLAPGAKPISMIGVASPKTPYTDPLSPAQLSKVYDIDRLHNLGAQGDGQTIAIFSPTFRYPLDITVFAASYGIQGYKINDILIDGGPGNYYGSGQAALDGEVILGQANHAAINYYEPPNTPQGLIDAYNQIAADNPAVLTSSWSTSETILHNSGLDWYVQAYEDVTTQMANQGISVFNHSGNSGAYAPADLSNVTVQMEAASSNVTGVGGTSLPDNYNGMWSAENAWSFDGDSGSGGGLSIYFQKPWWQTGPGVGNGYSNGFRQVPDVAALASTPFYNIYAYGSWAGFFGTGASTPLWASTVLLINQLAGFRQGNLNPALYDIAANRPFPFHDIRDGNNGIYPGTNGWDYVTGLGSANFGQLYYDLTQPTDLAPFNPVGQQEGWINAIMIHSDPYSYTEPAQFDDATTYYIDSAMINNGPADMPSATVKILVDSTPQTYTTAALGVNNYTDTGYRFPQKFTSGRHTITEIVNPDHTISESNYNNNTFARIINVVHVPQPTITSITPNPIAYGSTGQKLVINGIDFGNSAYVKIGGAVSTPTTISNTQITVPLADDLLKSSAPIHVSVTASSVPSNTYTINVNNCPTTIALSSVPTSPISTKAFRLTATVADPFGNITPTGIVTFKKGTTILGAGTLTEGTTGTATATINCPALPAGAVGITASYAGDGTFAANSLNATLNVTAALPTTTTVLTSPASAVATQAVSFTINVNGAGAAPTGSIALYVAGALKATLPLSGGVAYTAIPLPVGTDSVYAKYSGDPTYLASTSAAGSIVISKMNTTTSVASSNASAPIGAAVMLTAAVKPVAPAAGPAVGLVQFMDGEANLGTAVALDTSGNAHLTKSNFTIGAHSITAKYLGATIANASASTAFTQTIVKAAPSVTLLTPPSTVLQGQSDTFKASVTGISGTAATGNVTFKDGITTLTTVALASGVAPLNIASLAAGTHSITATYNGDSNYTAVTSAASTVVVKSNGTATMLTATPTTTAYSAAVKLTATVTPSTSGYTAITGSVTFKDGATTLGTATIAGGKAVYSTSLSVGTHSISVVYGGSTVYSGSTSAPATITINKENTTTSLTTSGASAAFGTALTFTAIAKQVAPGVAVPSGSIQFFDGTTSLGSIAVDGSGKATLAISNLSVRTHSIKATYLGNINVATSNSAVVTQIITKAKPTVTLSATATTITVGQSDTFTATVVGVAAAAPTGNVTFYDGTTVLGTVALAGGSASFNTSSLTIGNHTIKAIYAGDGNYLSVTSTTITVAVSAH